MNIRVLYKSDAMLYQQLRLRALQISPEAFSSTYEREVKFTLETVEERIQSTEDKFVLGAFVDHDLVGIVSFVRENGYKTDHKGNVYGMFIAPEKQGRGLGKSLLTELIGKARKYDGLEQIHLTVASENEKAKRLYKSLGFEVYGVEKRALKMNGKYLEEDLMVLQIHESE